MEQNERDLKLKQDIALIINSRFTASLEQKVNELFQLVNSEAEERQRSYGKTNEEIKDRRAKLYVMLSEHFRNVNYPTTKAIEDIEKLF